MNSPRGHAVAIALKSGKVLIAGGNADGDNQQVAKAELFDPATGTFSPTVPCTFRAPCFAAARLNDGKVLVAGGVSVAVSEHRIEETAEIYDSVRPAHAFASPGHHDVPVVARCACAPES